VVTEAVQEPDPQPHVHHPHHEHPFTIAEAAQRQSEAMEQAHAETLARLEAMAGVGAGPQGILGEGPAVKGPRATYDTMTSGPSFGHILHRDGHPISGLSSDFVRVPFGVPLGATLPRPMMLMRTGTGIGMGIGLPGLGMGRLSAGLSGIAESPEGPRREERSAYVETVEDVRSYGGGSNPADTAQEQEPTAKSAASPRPAKSAAPTARSVTAEQIPAKTESGIHPMRNSGQQPATRPASHAPITPVSSASPLIDSTVAKRFSPASQLPRLTLPLLVLLALLPQVQ
jgi:hypothetical protein